MRFWRRSIVAGAALLTSYGACVHPVAAAGFAVGQQGAASEGVAGAATARSDLPETAWYNPAATPPGLRASLGASAIFPSLVHEGDGTRTESTSGASTPPWVHVAYVHEYDRHAFGLAVVGNVPHGSGVEWPTDWPGRFEATGVELQVFELSASAIYGIQLRHDLELGAAFQYRRLRGLFGLSRQVDTVNDEASVELGGSADDNAFGGSLHARFKGLSLGVNYRTAVDLEFAGDAHFDNVPPELSGPAHDQPFATTLVLADRLAVGVAYEGFFGKPSLDVEYMGWSRFQTLEIDFADDETPDVSQSRNYRNTVTVRLGYEYEVLPRSLPVRIGFAIDPTPAPATSVGPTLPDSNRMSLSLGTGFRFPFGLGADIAYTHTFFAGAVTENPEALPGEYGGALDIVSLGLSYSSP